jgi:hypothetical protein
MAGGKNDILTTAAKAAGTKGLLNMVLIALTIS